MKLLVQNVCDLKEQPGWVERGSPFPSDLDILPRACVSCPLWIWRRAGVFLGFVIGLLCKVLKLGHRIRIILGRGSKGSVRLKRKEGTLEEMHRGFVGLSLE